MKKTWRLGKKLYKTEVHCRRPGISHLACIPTYFFLFRRLYIHLSKITDLPPRSQRAPTYDTFVNICLLPDEKHSFNSRIAKNNLNPPFEEVFTFNVDRSRGFENYTLRLSAYNADLPQWYNAIGHTLVPLANCVTPDEKPQDFKRKLSRRAKVSLIFNITSDGDCMLQNVSLLSRIHTKRLMLNSSSLDYLKQFAVICSTTRVYTESIRHHVHFIYIGVSIHTVPHHILL